MKTSALWLAFAAATFASSSVFSVHDDLLAFPQYEVIFSDTFILEDDASSRLDSATTSSSTEPHHATPHSDDNSAELAKHTSSKTQDASLSPSQTSNSYESMKLNGRSYLCAIPTVDTAPGNDTVRAKDKAEEAAELTRATDRGWELLKEMEGKCMYFISGWWSYSFCYNTDVKQFHQLPPGKGAPMYPPMQDPSTPAYVLGKFEQNHHPPSDSRSQNRKPKPRIDAPKGRNHPTEPSSHRTTPSTTQLRAKGDLRYLVQTLSGGTTCDLTGRPRKIEVQFHCHPQSADRIGWIKEVSTCSYLMVIYTPRLCNDVAFLPPRENKAAPITCQEILASTSDIPEWRQRKQNEAEQKLLAASSSGRPIVGGIEVGGMKLVGKEGQRIETPPSTAFNMRNGNGKDDVMTETLAAQESVEDGGKMTVKVSDDELRKMGLDPGVVEGARKELGEVAAGKGWKLEVFEVGDGVRELRGIVEGDEEEVGGEDQGEDGPDPDEGSEEVYKDEL
ncbi:MAG: hypothetical protein Q9221_005888 [Calogaya cf. arnoldii]